MFSLTCTFYSVCLILAAQMWCLGRLLPLLIGADITPGKQHWECFLKLMEIVDYVFAPVTSTEILDHLQERIETHHQLFTEIYPSSPVIPKLHYVIHIPEWIERFVGSGHHVVIVNWIIIIIIGP